MFFIDVRTLTQEELERIFLMDDFGEFTLIMPERDAETEVTIPLGSLGARVHILEIPNKSRAAPYLSGYIAGRDSVKEEIMRYLGSAAKWIVTTTDDIVITNKPGLFPGFKTREPPDEIV